MLVPQGKFSLVLNKEREKKKKKDNSLFRQKEHVFRSISVMSNQKVWNINMFAGGWKQLLITLITDFSSEVIKLEVA